MASQPSSGDLPTDQTTRLAPSPTGALHLGNARTFIINWAMARQRQWQICLRIEDLDGPRNKPGADLAAIEDLTWLGLDWDGAPTLQSANLAPYREALEFLRGCGLTYPCTCTRSDIRRMQSAPHADEHELRYPGTCRPQPGLRPHASDLPVATRIVVPDELICFFDRVAGPQTHDVQGQVGDFIVATKSDLPAYQLAVVIDDAGQQVTQVIRGDDLLRSTGRQLLLMRLLQLTPIPTYWHLPLVIGPDGRRLAKRHGDTRLTWYRHQGVPAERVIGLLASWSGIAPPRRPMDAVTFRAQFDIDRLPRSHVTFTEADQQWLLQS